MPESPIDALTDAIVALDRWLRAVNVPYALIGGVAVALQAAPRFTRDVDAVIWSADDRWDELLASAAAFSVVARQPDAIAFARRTRVLLLAHSGGVPIDVSCGALPFEEELIARAASIDIGAATVRVALPEHLLVMKAIANRPRDRVDIESLLRQFPRMDVTGARRIVREFSEALELPELLADFDRALRDRPST